MQIKAILFLVVIGAVAVLAKKGSSEEDGNGYNIVQVMPYPRPGPRPFKIKNPKHQVFVIGRPQQPFYPQPPQYPPAPQFQESQLVNPGRMQQYFLNIQRQMQGFSAKAYKEFQRVENEIERSKTKLEDTLKSQFQTLELSLEAKQEKEIKQAVKDGKDEVKIQECLAEEEQDFRAEMNSDIERTSDCINDATEEARRTLKEARNAFTETSVTTSYQARRWSMLVRSCAEQKDVPCVQEGVTLIDNKIKSYVEEGSRHFRNLEEATERQMIQLDYCRQNFMEDLKDMREAYSTMVKRCVIASEISKPEEEEEEGEDEEKVEEKPAVDVEAGVEVDA